MLSLQLQHVRRLLAQEVPLEHPESRLFKTEYYKASIREKHIWQYYDLAKRKMVPFYKEKGGRHVFIVSWMKGGKTIVRRHPSGSTRWLTVKSAEEFDKLNTGRAVSFYFSMEQTWDEAFVDLDPRPGFPWDEVRDVALEVWDALAHSGEFKSVDAKFSGHRGFHIRGTFGSRRNTNTSRKLLQEILSEIETDDVTTRLQHKTRNWLRLDTTINKKDGVVSAPWMIHYKSGLIAVPVKKSEIAAFKREDYTIPKVSQRTFGQRVEID